MKKKCIYSFHDRAAVVDESTQFFLKDLKQNFDSLIVVTLGDIVQESISIIQQYTSDIVSCSYSTSFAEGYRKGCEYLGWDSLRELDLLVFCNSSLFGPFNPTLDMYIEMDKRTCDYWGIVKHYECKSDPYPYNKYGGIPEHLKSSLLAFKKTILQTGELKRFFKTIPKLLSEKESLGGFSIRYEKYFSSKGFSSDCYIKDIYRGVSDNPYLTNTFDLIFKNRVPFIEKETFYCDISRKMDKSLAVDLIRGLERVQRDGIYPVEALWKNLLRNHNLYDLKNNLCLNHIISEDYLEEPVEQDLKTALVTHVYFEDLIPVCLEKAKSMPKGHDLIITTSSKDIEEQVYQWADKLEVSLKSVIRVENRGRDVSALLVGCKDILKEYDLVCFFHDKKSSHQDLDIIGQSFFKKCIENLLFSPSYVAKIIKLFHENKRLGILMPPLPGPVYYILYGKGWDKNFDTAQKLTKQLNLNIPFSEECPPIGPFGSMFWFRPESISQIFDYGWNYEDFPAEPMAIDGTISHSIERIYPYVAQHNGFYSAYVMTDNYASADLINSHYILNSYNKVLFDKYLIYEFKLLLSLLKSLPNKRLFTNVLFRKQADSIKGLLRHILPYKSFLKLIKLKRFIFGPRYLSGNLDDSNKIVDVLGSKGNYE